MTKAYKKAIDLTLEEIIKISIKYGGYFSCDNCPLQAVKIKCFKLCELGRNGKKEIMKTLENQMVEFELED